MIKKQWEKLTEIVASAGSGRVAGKTGNKAKLSPVRAGAWQNCDSTFGVVWVAISWIKGVGFGNSDHT